MKPSTEPERLRIDRNSPVPLYYQLKQILLEQIEKRLWKVGELIPSEQELQATFGLSRTTVRQTLSELVNEGHLTRHRGRGTFIAEPKVIYNTSVSSGLKETVEQKNIILGWHILSQRWIDPSPHLQTMLKISSANQIYFIERLRLAGDKPIGHHIAYIVPMAFKYINSDQLLQGESLDYLTSHPDLRSAHVHRTLEAIEADKVESDLLSIPIGAPLLQMDRLITGDDGTPIEFLRAKFRGDRFKYEINHSLSAQTINFAGARTDS